METSYNYRQNQLNQKRYISIWFQHLKTDWMSRQQPRLKNVPWALTFPDHGRLKITEPGFVARKNGLQAGTVAADARIAQPSIEFIEDDPQLAKKILHKLCEWTIRFTPTAAVDYPDGLILDVTGCAHLWGDEEKYLQEIYQRLQSLGYHIRLAMADTIGAAWAVARYGNHNAIVEPGQQLRTLCALPPASLRIEIPVIERMFKLGFQTVGEFISMKQNVLFRRFGQHFIDRLLQATGEKEEFIVPLIPSEPFEERLFCMEPIHTRKGIEIALEKLLGQMIPKLKKNGKGIRTAAFKCFRIDGKVEQVSISTSKPSSNFHHLHKLFEINIERISPGMGIEFFMLLASRVQDSRSDQQSFWSVNHDLLSDEVAQLLDYIQGKFGKECVERYLPAAHHLPERAIRKAASLPEQPDIPWPTSRPRPVILLQRPEKIIVTAPVPDYPPMNFTFRGILHAVSKADGPERIEPEWWIKNGLHRDYYIVENTEGKRFWLFRSGHYDNIRKPDWFIHGIFA